MSRYGRENDIEDIDGGLRPSEPQQRPSEIVARPHEAGIVEQRLAENGRGVLVTPMIEEKQAAVIVGLRVARIGGQSALEGVPGIVVALQGAQNEDQLAAVLGDLGPDGAGPCYPSPP